MKPITKRPQLAALVVARGEVIIAQYPVEWEKAKIGDAVNFMATPDTLDVPKTLRRPLIKWAGRVIDIRHDATGRTLYAAVIGWPNMFTCRIPTPSLVPRKYAEIRKESRQK